MLAVGRVSCIVEPDMEVTVGLIVVVLLILIVKAEPIGPVDESGLL